MNIKASDTPPKQGDKQTQRILMVRHRTGSCPAPPPAPSKVTERLFGLDQALPLAASAGKTETAED